jgi:hypothetical protein
MADVTDKLVRLHSLMFPQAPVPIRSAEAGSTVPVPALEDDDLIERASHAKDGDKFQRLWEGSHNGYPSQSEADLSIMQHSRVLDWQGCSPNGSTLPAVRPDAGKWERERLPRRDDSEACESTVNTYSPHKAQTGIDAHRNGATVPAIREAEPLAVVNARTGTEPQQCSKSPTSTVQRSHRLMP